MGRKIIGLLLFLGLFAGELQGQYELSVHGMGGNMKSHSAYNRNMDSRPLRGIQVEEMWLVRPEPSGGIGPANSLKMLGISAFCYDLGDGLRPVNDWVNKGKPAMGQAFGIMTKVATKTVLGIHSLGGRGINQFRWEFGGGFLYVNQVFDSLRNPANEAMSFPVNFAAQMRLQLVSHVTKTLSVSAGVYGFHTSNSNWRKPNVGLNYAGLDVGLHYRFHERQLQHQGTSGITVRDACYLGKKRVSMLSSEKWEVALKGAVREYRWDRPVVYSCFVGSFQYQLGDRFWRLGMDVFYEKGSGKLVGGETAANPLKSRIETGFYLRKIFRFGWVDMFMDLGGYIVPPQSDRVKDLSKNKYFYNALGAQYHLNEHWSVLHRIKAHKNIADYMEFGVSYCW